MADYTPAHISVVPGSGLDGANFLVIFTYTSGSVGQGFPIREFALVLDRFEKEANAYEFAEKIRGELRGAT